MSAALRTAERDNRNADDVPSPMADKYPLLRRLRIVNDATPITLGAIR